MSSRIFHRVKMSQMQYDIFASLMFVVHCYNMICLEFSECIDMFLGCIGFWTQQSTV